MKQCKTCGDYCNHRIAYNDKNIVDKFYKIYPNTNIQDYCNICISQAIKKIRR